MSREYMCHSRKTKSLFNWLARITGTDAVWIEAIDHNDQPVWALAKRLSRACWYLVSKKLKATAAIATLGGALLLPSDSLHAQTGMDLSNLTGVNGFTLNGSDGDIPGTTYGDLSGRALASGDINGDGFEDMIIGAYTAADAAGETYVVFGTSTAFASAVELSSLDGNTGFVLHGIDGNSTNPYGDLSGRALASGDINGDGIDDIIIGARSADPNGANAAGETYVVFGKTTAFTSVVELSLLDGSTGFVLHGIDGGNPYGGDSSGCSVGSGDINGDGIDDIIIGARFASPNGTRSGETYVVFGKSTAFASVFKLSSLNGATGFVLNGVDGDDRSGEAVASGDINGDGTDDVIIGARFADPNGTQSAGETYVVFGKSTAFTATVELSSLDGSTGFVVNGIDVDDWSGFAVSSGDINGDGTDDVIIGAHLSDPNGNQKAGETYVVFGFDDTATDTLELSTLDGATGFVLNGIASGDESGYAVTSGDINGDGFDDVIIGAHRANPNGNQEAGETYMVFGFNDNAISTLELSSLNGVTGFVLNGVDYEDNSGLAVASGDIDGDGFSNVIIGAPWADPNGESRAGKTHVFTQIPAAVTLAGNEGLRMLAIPASGTVLDEFLPPLRTQGMTGADYDGGFANVWLWDDTLNTTGNWTGVSDITTQSLPRGQGFSMLVFSDDDFDGNPEGFPKILSTINIFNSAVVDTGTVTPVTNLGDGRYFLVGNPYVSTFDWDSASVIKTNLSNTIYVWDNVSGQYQSWNGTSGNITKGRIEPFQSFFIQALGGTGTLSIGEDARTDSSGTFYKQFPRREPRILSIQAEAGNKKADAWLNFQEGGELQRDKYDGLYLQPHTAEFLKLGTILASEEVLQINALPVDQQEQLVIPLDLSGTVKEPLATLHFEGLETFEGWELSIHDTQTGKEFPIEENVSLELEIELFRAKLEQPALPTPVSVKAKAAGSRYQIVVVPGASIHDEPGQGVPLAIELQQNYPNPFNPSTTIEFGVPMQGNVRLEVFDILGRKAAELLNESMQPGRYSVNFDASGFSSGIYIYQLSTEGAVVVKKMTIVK